MALRGEKTNSIGFFCFLERQLSLNCAVALGGNMRNDVVHFLFGEEDSCSAVVWRLGRTKTNSIGLFCFFAWTVVI